MPVITISPEDTSIDQRLLLVILLGVQHVCLFALVWTLPSIPLLCAWALAYVAWTGCVAFWSADTLCDLLFSCSYCDDICERCDTSDRND